MWGSPASGGWAVIGSSTAAEIRSLRESSRRGRRLRAASRRRLSSRKSTLGACRRNAPTPNLGGTKRIGRIEIVDPEPDARSHSSSQCRQTHYSDTLLGGRNGQDGGGVH